MANLAARTVDTWLSLLNKAHLIPVNAATLLRSINAKQFGDSNFRPQPLTSSNFTDAELDAIARLASDGNGGFKNIVSSSYGKIFPKDIKENGIVKAIPKGGHGDETMALSEYISPARVISTTIGRALVGKDGNDTVLKDTYDFNRAYLRVHDNGNGTFTTPQGNTYPNSELKTFLDKGEDVEFTRKNTTYGKLRSNASFLAHNGKDPDSQKIKINVSFNDIKRRLGNRLGTFDILKSPSKRELMLKSIAAGGLTALPIGASAGLLSGIIQLLDRDKRKKWRRTLLNSTLVGAGLAGLAGAAAGPLVLNKIEGAFGKKAEAPRKKKRRSFADSLRRAAINSLSVATPAAALAGIGYLAHKKVRPIYDKLLQKIDVKNEFIPIVTEDEDLMYREPVIVG